jgi:preprotein translocase subunit YajC
MVFISWTHSFQTLLFAAGEAAGPGAPAADAPGGLSFPMMALIMILVLGYFMIWMPERKKQKAFREQISSLKKNDRVVTIGGIYGTVANINREADKVTLKVDDGSNVKLDFTLGAISRVVVAETQGEKDSDKSGS